MNKKQDRSEHFTYPEFIAFVKWANRYPSRKTCADAIGISRVTLDSILNHGKGRKSIIDLIRNEISELV